MKRQADSSPEPLSPTGPGYPANGGWWLKGIAGLSVFVVPLLAILSLWSLVDRQQEAQGRREARENVEQMVAGVARLASPVTFFQDYAQRLSRRLKWDGHLIEPSGVSATRSVRLFAFSRQGKRLEIPGTTPGLVYASEQSWAALKQMENAGSAAVSRRETALLESFLGAAQGIEDLARRSGRLVELGSSASGGMLAGRFPFSSPKWGKGEFLTLVDLGKVSPQALVRDALVKIRLKAGDSYAFGALDLWKEVSAERGGSGRSAFARQLLAPGRGRIFTWKGKYISTNTISRRFLVFGVTKVPPSPGRMPERILGKQRVVYGWIFLVLVWLAVHPRLFIPLRLQVLGLFAVAALANIVTLAGFAEAYRVSWEESLLQENFSRSRDILDKLDNRFAAALHGQAAKYAQLLAGAGDRPRSLEAILSRLRTFEKYRGSILVSLVGREGEFLYRLQPENWFFLSSSPGEGSRKMLSLIGMYALRRHYREHVDNRDFRHTYSSKTPDPSHGIAMESGLYLNRMRRRIFPIRTADRNMFLFSDFWLDEREYGRASLLIAHEWRFLETMFLRREIRRMNALLASRNWKLRAVSDEQNPAWIERDELLRRFHLSLFRAQNAGWIVRPVGRSSSMVTGFPARHLEGHNLMLVTPMAPIEEQISRFLAYVRLFAFLLFLFSLILASLFSSLLLEPLSEISKGIRQLAAGDFTRKISVASGDALDKIGQGINEIMDELKERMTATEIQEHLFPASHLAIDGMTFRGRVAPAREIIGEYFDYVALGERTAAFWLVRAHGSSLAGALGLANSKMALRLLFRTDRESPRGVLEKYLSLFPEVVGGETSGLSVLAGVVSPSENRMRIVNPGGFIVCKWQAGCWKEAELRGPGDAGTTSEIEIPFEAGDRIGFGACREAFSQDFSSLVLLEASREREETA